MTDGLPGGSVSRRAFALLGAGAVAVTVASCTDAPDEPTRRRTAPVTIGGYRPIAIGGGGWVTGLAVAGTAAYARTDVGGAYSLGPGGAWHQLITFTSVGKDLDPADYRVDAIACAPSDPRRVAVLTAPSDTRSLGNLLLSKDAGRSWTRSSERWSVAPTTDGASGGRIAFDPIDEQRLYVATGDRRLFASDDFGGTWTSLSMPPGRSTTDGSGLLSAVVMTSQRAAGEPLLWVGVTGSGLWRSADRGGTWARAHPLSHPSDRISDLQPVDDGVLICVESTTGGGGLLRVPTSGEQATPVGPEGAISVRSIAVDPANPDRAFLVPSYVDPSQVFFISDDLTSSAPGWRQQRWSIGRGGSSTWPPRVRFETLSSGQARYVGSQLLYAEGMGVWRVDTDGGSTVLTPSSAGIEELVGNRVLKPASGPLLTASWDRGVLAVTNPVAERPEVEPLRRGFGSAWDLSISPTDPAFVAAILDDHQDPTGRAHPDRRSSGYSTDGGRSWTRFPALNGNPPADLLFGNIAVSAQDSRNLVWLPSNLSGTASAIYWTVDRGATWTRARLNGLSDEDLLHPTYTLARKVLVADPVSRGRFTLLGATREGTPVVWRSVDGGRSWTKSTPRGLSGVKNAQYGAQLAALGNGLIAVTGASDGGVLRADDSGRWVVDDSLRGGVAIAVGPRPSARGFELAFISTSGDERPALHVSTDNAQTWRRAAGPALDLNAPIRSLATDPAIAGRVYLATGGNGFASIDLAASNLR